MLNKAKNYFKNLKKDAWDFMSKHPAISGYTIGALALYFTALGSCLVTGKKWYLEEKH